MAWMVSVAHRSWPELVFHLLAHVAVQAPASVHDPVYVQWAASRLGPAEERTLGEDARVLARLLPSHQSLAAVQLLGWLFDDVEQARRCAETDLVDLPATAVARPELLGPLCRLGAPLELLRCAAELEADAFSTLPPLELDAVAVEVAARGLLAVAPGLARAKIFCLRSLRLRGRVRAEEIFVGCPSGSGLGPTVDHVVWQAAHEATVVEVGERDSWTVAWSERERRLEVQALELLAERAAAAGMAEAHGRWLAHLSQRRE